MEILTFDEFATISEYIAKNVIGDKLQKVSADKDAYEGISTIVYACSGVEYEFFMFWNVKEFGVRLKSLCDVTTQERFDICPSHLYDEILTCLRDDEHLYADVKAMIQDVYKLDNILTVYTDVILPMREICENIKTMKLNQPATIGDVIDKKLFKLINFHNL